MRVDRFSNDKIRRQTLTLAPKKPCECEIQESGSSSSGFSRCRTHQSEIEAADHEEEPGRHLEEERNVYGKDGCGDTAKVAHQGQHAVRDERKRGTLTTSG